jgi:hypothetical protein
MLNKKISVLFSSGKAFENHTNVKARTRFVKLARWALLNYAIPIIAYYINKRSAERVEWVLSDGFVEWYKADSIPLSIKLLISAFSPVRLTEILRKYSISHWKPSRRQRMRDVKRLIGNHVRDVVFDLFIYLRWYFRKTAWSGFCLEAKSSETIRHDKALDSDVDENKINRNLWWWSASWSGDGSLAKSIYLEDLHKSKSNEGSDRISHVNSSGEDVSSVQTAHSSLIEFSHSQHLQWDKAN